MRHKRWLDLVSHGPARAGWRLRTCVYVHTSKYPHGLKRWNLFLQFVGALKSNSTCILCRETPTRNRIVCVCCVHARLLVNQSSVCWTPRLNVPKQNSPRKQLLLFVDSLFYHLTTVLNRCRYTLYKIHWPAVVVLSRPKKLKELLRVFPTIIFKQSTNRKLLERWDGTYLSLYSRILI